MSALNNAPRLFESDLTPMEPVILFNGLEYKTRLKITAYGEMTGSATDVVSILIESSTTAAADHYKKIVARCSELNHENFQLKYHIQV